MEGPTFDVLGFLAEPGRPASVATVSGRGRPALAMMWFLVEDERLWFHTARSPGQPAPFVRAARERAEVAVMVATFDPPADVRQVRLTGPARLEERDDARVRRLYRRYVDAWTRRWGTAGDGGELPVVVDVARPRHGGGLPRSAGRPDLPVVGAVRVVRPGGAGRDPVGSPSAADDGRWDMSIGIGVFLMVLGAILAFAVETDVPGVNVKALGVILMLIGLVAVGYSLLFWSNLTPWGRRRIITRRRMVGEQPVDEGPFDDRLP